MSTISYSEKHDTSMARDSPAHIENGLDDKPLYTGGEGLEGAVTNTDELRQGFSIWALLAVALILGGAWGTFLQTLPTTIIYGGNRLLLYGLWVTWFGMQAIYLSLAEMASAWPISSGPQEWAFQLFPAKYKRVASYFIAWGLSIFYLFATLACTTLEARQIVGLAAYFNETYIPAKIHVWAVGVALILLNTVINTFGIRLMDHLQTFSLLWFCAGFLIWLIVPVSRSPVHATAQEVFTSTLNLSGWGGFVSFMIGMSGLSIGYGAADTVTHLAEETSRPAIDLPRVMALSPVLSLITATGISLSFLFCGVDLVSMVQSTTGVPCLDFLNATVGSRAAVVCLTIIILYGQFMASFQCQLAGSRTIFTFAREGGAFFPKHLGSVHPRLQVPVWSILLSAAFCIVFSLILLGSDLALNSIVGCVAVLLNTIYIPLVVMHMINKKKFSRGPWHLGRWAPAVNAVALVYMIFTNVMYHFPYALPNTIQTMNYNCVIVPGLLLIGIIPWVLSGRKRYMVSRRVE